MLIVRPNPPPTPGNIMYFFSHEGKLYGCSLGWVVVIILMSPTLPRGLASAPVEAWDTEVRWNSMEELLMEEWLRTHNTREIAFFVALRTEADKTKYMRGSRQVLRAEKSNMTSLAWSI